MTRLTARFIGLPDRFITIITNTCITIFISLYGFLTLCRFDHSPLALYCPSPSSPTFCLKSWGFRPYITAGNYHFTEFIFIIAECLRRMLSLL